MTAQTELHYANKLEIQHPGESFSGVIEVRNGLVGTSSESPHFCTCTSTHTEHFLEWLPPLPLRSALPCFPALSPLQRIRLQSLLHSP